ncbi:hypothetical protein GC102_33735 [Paenibacillus sp. LMG 31460]|uniref:Flavodoxin-like fold n=1 Tax=Paenibacillus germinis TaxID=2654979 RepID=A0ABX1ZDS8_9BACL|nr:NAD(P)H-dependent oxidoreductase [Paenibacillus germinis]NOU90654.1 hypothetical protein [Paenibacillus germinis]
MNHLIIYTHSRKSSFNNAILDTVTESYLQGDGVVVRDLYGRPRAKEILNSTEIREGSYFTS